MALVGGATTGLAVAVAGFDCMTGEATVTGAGTGTSNDF